MKKKKRIISAFLAVVCTAMLAVTQIAAEPALTLRGQINWTNEPDTESLRPESVNVYLLADGSQVDQTEASAKENWQFSFVVSPAEVLPTYTYSIGSVPGYEEETMLRVDPKINVIPAQIGTWEKYEPCNRLVISHEILSNMLIAGKMTKHQPLVIWSREPLTETEQANIEASFRALPGVGNPPPAEFISGDGAEKYGMKISLTEGVVNFDDPSQWSLLFGSSYTYGKTEAGEGSLTLRWIPVFDPPTDPAPIQPEPEPVPVEPEPAPVEPEPAPIQPQPAPTQPTEDDQEPPVENIPMLGPPSATEATPEKPVASPTVLQKPMSASGTISAPKTGTPLDYYVGICGLLCSLAMITGLLIWKKHAV